MAASTVAVNAAEFAVCAAAAAAAAAGDGSLPADPTSTLTERLQSLVALPLKAEDLRSLKQPVRTLLEANLVFAAHEVNGHSRHAKIHLEDGRLYLYSLRDWPLPLGAAIVQVDEVVPSPPCLVFLDLVWPGTPRRRVVVRLNPVTPLGRQFVLLCTGQRGPCYANTHIFEVVHKGKPGEFVAGGDYEKNDGTGGPALLTDLDKGQYHQSGKVGNVLRTWCDDNKSDWNACFGICTKDMEDGGVFAAVFGKVEVGLDAVLAAAQHTPITEVTVADCGVVL